MVGRTKGSLGDETVKLRMLSCRGVSEGRWEGTREIWYGDMDRDRSGSVRKRARTDDGPKQEDESVQPGESEFDGGSMAE
jgi:hypothetical protein